MIFTVSILEKSSPANTKFDVINPLNHPEGVKQLLQAWEAGQREGFTLLRRKSHLPARSVSAKGSRIKQQEEGYPSPLLLPMISWCRRGDLNPHGDYPPPPQDGVSTNSTTSAIYSVASALNADDIRSPTINEGATIISLLCPLLLGLRHGYLRLSRNLLGFSRGCLNWPFLHHRGSPLC